MVPQSFRVTSQAQTIGQCVRTSQGTLWREGWPKPVGFAEESPDGHGGNHESIAPQFWTTPSCSTRRDEVPTPSAHSVNPSFFNSKVAVPHINLWKFWAARYTYTLIMIGAGSPPQTFSFWKFCLSWCRHFRILLFGRPLWEVSFRMKPIKQNQCITAGFLLLVLVLVLLLLVTSSSTQDAMNRWFSTRHCSDSEATGFVFA